ncbi:MAG: hypothetical protein EBZ87_00325 [Microbacteriaceae bacterium]|nr:hypothetical protein [Microbacteriaceae bacterium]
MSATYIGYSGTALITESTYEEDKDGLATYTQKTLTRPSASLPTPSLTKTISIGGETLRMVSVNVVSGSGNFKEITETFQGQSTTRTLQQNATNSTGEEPIETNYNFLVGNDGRQSIVNLSGGALTEGQAVNSTTGGAVFDENGKFLYFNKNAQNKLFGVTSYLNPNITYRRSFTTTTTPDLSAVGRIITPSSDFPASTTGATWLCTSIQYTQRGQTFEVSHDFRSSDKKGWNTYIYGDATSAPSTS